MAARLRKTHQADIREKIRAGLLVKHLEDHALGKRDMGKSQVTAALGLLRKVVPDLQSTTISGDPDNPLAITDPKDALLRGLAPKSSGSGTAT